MQAIEKALQSIKKLEHIEKENFLFPSVNAGNENWNNRYIIVHERMTTDDNEGIYICRGNFQEPIFSKLICKSKLEDLEDCYTLSFKNTLPKPFKRFFQAMYVPCDYVYVYFASHEYAPDSNHMEVFPLEYFSKNSKKWQTKIEDIILESIMLPFVPISTKVYTQIEERLFKKGYSRSMYAYMFNKLIK